MKDIPKEVVFVLLVVYAVILVIQSYVLLDYGITGKAGEAGACIGSLPTFTSLDCPVNVTAGKVFFCEISATSSIEGEEIIFTDNSTLFTIGRLTGIIAFSPGLEDIGTQNVLITLTTNCFQNTGVINFTVTKPICGNHIIELGETCDPPSDTCSSTCQLIPTTTITQNVGGAAGGGGGLGAPQRQIGMEGLTMTAPSSISITEGNTVDVPVYITNTERVDMEEVFVSVTSNPLYVKAVPEYFARLVQGKSEKVILSIGANGTNPGNHLVEILTFSKKPKFERKKTIYVTVAAATSSQLAEKTKKQVTKLELAYQLLVQYPQCIIIKELIEQAQAAVIEGKFEQGEAIAQSAVEICYYLAGITPKEPVQELPTSSKQMEKTSNITVSLIVIGLLMILIIAYFLSSRKTETSSTLTRVDALIQEVYKALDKGDVATAKHSYAALRRLYGKLKKHDQARVYKDIMVLYKEIEDAVKK